MIADALLQFLGGQQPRRFDDLALRVRPAWLDRIEPRALLWEEADDDPDGRLSPFDRAVVLTQPVADGGAVVPRGVVPDQQQRRLARLGQPSAAPGEEVGRGGADRAALDEAHPDRFWFRQQQPVAGDGLGIRIVFGDRLLDQPQWVADRFPPGQGGLADPAEPDFIFEPERPVGMATASRISRSRRRFVGHTRGRGW